MSGHPNVYCVLMAGKVPNHCGVGLVFYGKHMSLESVNDPIFSFSNIYDIAPVAFQAINHIIVLVCAMHHNIISPNAVYNSPEREMLPQHLEACGLLHPLDLGGEGH